MRRKITEQLLTWKQQTGNKPCLLIKGARQVGKTYIVDKFARENYDNYIYINFELNPEYKTIFDGNLDFTTLKQELEVAFPEQAIVKGETILFLDEIQACPNARVALKSFALNGTIDVVASGSLLGLHYKEVRSYPVGYERVINLYPFDFEEFLWGLGVQEDVIETVKAKFATKQPLSQAMLQALNKYFRTFILVGGMPEAVRTYVETKSFREVLNVQRAILESYKNDVMKYASTADKQKILSAVDSIPVQLAKKNKKFIFNDIDINDDNASERKYGSALAWLRDAGIVNFCYNLSEPALPLNANRKLESYKIYLRDTGLLIAMLETGTQKAILDDNLYINEGAILENVCAGELIAHGHSLNYFERKSRLEIDFVLNIEGVATVVEVKSGANKQAKSLDSIMENYRTVGRRIKLERDTNIEVTEDGVEHYPLPMIMCL